MYVKSIAIDNIRSIERLSLDFTSPSDIRRCVLILGNNGVGKTTILRCIALGLCDDTSASALLSELAVGNLKRRESKGDARISLTLVGPDQRESTITTVLKERDSRLEVVVDAPHKFSWNRIFCCGYGIARRPFASESYREYRLVDSVYSLFNYDSNLWSPEIVLSRLARSRVKQKNLFNRLEDILELPRDCLSLDETGIVVSGPWKGGLGLFSLGDGYSATLGWLADMLGWALLHHGPQLDVNTLSGIVLVDMIERDLHPSWQRTILRNLRLHFPGIQFIATTHAPMCAIGASELPDDECELIALQLRDNRLTAVENIHPPRTLRVDEVLTSIMFNVNSVSGSTLRNQLERFIDLRSQGPSKKRGRQRSDELGQLESILLKRFAEASIDSRLLELLDKVATESLDRLLSGMSVEELNSTTTSIERLHALLRQDQS